ncbi:MAG: DUF433 domain-containing protein [Phycisphaerae bacterium]|nr:DUF433 domain-containing protein [Phycisphaerae bacterium]
MGRAPGGGDNRQRAYDSAATDRLSSLRSRVTIEADKMGGAPCIRGLRIPVATIIRCLKSGMTRDELLEQYPALESLDVDAAVEFEADRDQG